MTTNNKETKTTMNITAPYKFNKDELKDMGIKLAETCGKQGEIETEKSEVMKDYKQKIDAKQEEIDTLCQKIQSREEERVYKCHEEKNFENLEKIYTDSKTKQVIKRVPFTAEDHQIGIEDSVKA